MFTIGTAAYKLYSASQNVGSTLSTLSNYHKYVTEAIFNSPSEVENLHPLVKQNLDRLARRIQVLSKPLNYCLLWSQHRGSAVAETIHQCKEVLKQTYHWLHKCNKDKTKLSDKEYMLKKLDEHIREIDFCLQSLNLALSIIQTTDNIINPFPSSSSTTTNTEYISPSSLLTASNRIMAMHNSGGDVAICFGQLFKKDIKDNCGWQRIYRRSALKIYRNRMGRRYELRIECNEYGYDSDDMYMDNNNNMNHSNMDFNLNTSHPLTLKFDLTSSVYFTTLSSLLIDLPHRNNASFINVQHINKNELIEDAFGWVQMLANQVQQQYIFVLKSGLDDWDQPLSSSDDEQQPQISPQKHSAIQPQPPSNNKRTKQTSLIFLKDGARKDSLEEEHEIVYTKSRRSLSDDNDDSDDISEQQDTIQPLPPSHHHHQYIPNHNNNNNNMQQSQLKEMEHHDEHDYHLTASIASLDTAVQQTRHRTHLGQLLAPGGDYDESHVTPQLMAYMTRLAIYENDYTKPHTVYHTNSTFKKYKSSQQQPRNNRNDDDDEELDRKEQRDGDSDDSDDDDESEHDNQSVMISTSLTKQESNGSVGQQSNGSGGSVSTEISEYDLTNDDHSSEFTHHQTDTTKIFPSQHTIKQQQKIPAHLSACDEELNLFLQNPPSPPIPFYPTHIHFVSTSSSSIDQYQNQNQNQQQTYSRRKRQKNKNNKSPQRKKYGTSTARQYKRLNARRPHHNAKSVTNNKSYFAAPKVNEVTITYPNVIQDRNNNNDNNNKSSLLHEHQKNDKNNNDNDGNLSLSISDENHMKYLKKDKNKKLELTPKTKESMAAIKDATNSSLLENVDITTSQTFSAANSPRNHRNAHEDDDDHMLHGNFANLSIDNDD